MASDGGRETPHSADAPISLAALRQVALVGASISAGRGLDETLQAIAETLVDHLGFGCAAVNYGPPGRDFMVVAVAGPEAARAALLGQVTTRRSMTTLLSAAEEFGPLRLLRDSRLEEIDADDVVFWVPDIPEPDQDDDWHRDDCLFAIMERSDGAVIGVLSLDMPPGGKRPSPLLCELIGVYAMQATAAVASAQLTRQLLEERHQLRLERSRLAASEAALRYTFASSVAGMATLHLEVDRPGRFREANDAFCRLVGYRHDELVARRWPDLVAAEERAAVEGEMRGIAEGLDGPAVTERRVVRSDGAVVWLEVMSSVIAAGSEHRPFVLLQAQDVTARLARHADLLAQAHQDALTGLMNRRRLIEHLGDAVRRTRASGSPGALLYCDLDRFKEINDRYGHAAGDLALREVADRLRAEVRSHDVVARFGGDEFVVLAEDIDEEGVVALVERIRAAFEVPLACVPAAANISVGWVVIDRLARDAAEILDQGDVAMYADKARRVGEKK